MPVETNKPSLKYSRKLRAYFLLMKDSTTASIAKAAGFGFHKKLKQWFTYDPYKASTLEQYAGPKTLKRLRVVAQTIKWSRATGHEDFCRDIVLRAPPEGYEYLP